MDFPLGLLTDAVGKDSKLRCTVHTAMYYHSKRCNFVLVRRLCVFPL